MRPSPAAPSTVTTETSALASDALAVFCLFASVAVAAIVTYARLPARELYLVTQPGIDTGIRRGLAFAGFPTAPVAVAIAWLLADRLTGRVVTLAALAATILGSAVFWPGAVEEADPDGRPVSLLALTGVVAVIASTVAVARSSGLSRPRLHVREERFRVLVTGIVFLVEIPWIAALIGVSLDHVPVLNSIYLSDSLLDQPGVPGLHPAVHAGLHHGLCGALLVTSSIWLSRHLGALRSRRRRRLLAGYFSLLIAYGGANALQDFWLEQVVKRDLFSWQFPYMLQPRTNWAFAAILAAAFVVYLALLRPGAVLDRDTRPPALPSLTAVPRSSRPAARSIGPSSSRASLSDSRHPSGAANGASARNGWT